MTDEHKKAIANGRSEGATVKRYLEAIQVKGKPGRPLDPARLEAKLGSIEDELVSTEDSLRKLQLEQEKIDTQRKLETLNLGTKVDIAALEDAFVEVAKSYAERKGISYAAFRNVGVPANILKRAGVTR